MNLKLWHDRINQKKYQINQDYDKKTSAKPQDAHAFYLLSLKPIKTISLYGLYIDKKDAFPWILDFIKTSVDLLIHRHVFQKNPVYILPPNRREAAKNQLLMMPASSELLLSFGTVRMLIYHQ